METITNTVTTPVTQNPARKAAIHGLAIVGFIALILIGIGTAIYASRYVPAAISRIGAGAVYFSSIFTPGDKNPGLQVVTPGETIPFGTSTPETTSTSTAPATTTSTTASKPIAPSNGPSTSTTYTQGGGATTPQTLYGLPDLAVSVTSVGYLTTDSTDSFVASTTVPNGMRPAIKFAVTNVGTNVSGIWNFQANIPTSPAYTFSSPDQESLRPGDHVEYTLGFDRAVSGDRTITITLDPSKSIAESNENNNSVSVTTSIK